MKIYLAVDILDGRVVQGYKGQRDIYKPLDWGLAKSVIPHEYLAEMRPKNVYIADLNRILGKGDNNEAILVCGILKDGIDSAVINRGSKMPEARMGDPSGRYADWADKLEYVISTETCRGIQSDFDFEFFSIVIKDGLASPSGEAPEKVFKECVNWNFKGGVVMNLSSVGAEDSMGGLDIEAIRKAYPHPKTLLYGGGVNSTDDLMRLKDAGYDGAIIATSVHKGRVPLELLRAGEI
jgi:phosphoribosylformimino-5-aminoimidazole carboxamide ribotide isomerase